MPEGKATVELRDVLFFGGVALASAGAGLWDYRAGLVTAGLLFAVVGILGRR